MAQTFINFVVILIVVFCGLESINTDANVDVTYFIDVSDFRRPILVEQTKIIPDDCSGSCDDPRIEKELNKNIHPKSYEGLNSKCDGWLEKCVDFSGWKGATVQGQYCSTRKHLTWARDANLTTYGPEYRKCNGDELKSVLEANVIGTDRCHTCLCICTEGSENDGPNTNWAFSLQPQVADVANDMVVVGVRFREENQIIRMEIKEGKYKTTKEGHWKPADKKENLVRHVDYSPLVPRNRSIQLEKLVVPDGFVITGLRFVTNSTNVNGQEWVLRLEVQGTKFDVTSGTLMKDTSIWYSFDDMDTSSTNYNKPRFEVKTKGHVAWNGISKSIIFETTDIKTDLGRAVKPTLIMDDYEFEHNSPFQAIQINYVNDNSGSLEYLVPKIYTDTLNAAILKPTISTTTIDTITFSASTPTPAPGMGTALKASTYSTYVVLSIMVILFCYGT